MPESDPKTDAELAHDDTSAGAESAVPIDADEVLLAAVDQARAELTKITPADTVGDPIGHIVEGEHVLSLLFECTMTGYPGWHWTVSMSRIDENSAPSVLETELMPGSDALLAPDWIPWSDRLSDYRAAQDLAAALAVESGELDELEELDDDEDSDDELDDDELDDEENTDGLDEDELDDLDDEEFGVEDNGVDVLDGIDFDGALDGALATAELHPGESDEAEDDADDSAPEPPAEAVGIELSVEDEKHD